MMQQVLTWTSSEKFNRRMMETWGVGGCVDVKLRTFCSLKLILNKANQEKYAAVINMDLSWFCQMMLQ